MCFALAALAAEVAFAQAPVAPSAPAAPAESAAQRLANQQGGPGDRAQVERRMASVATLLEKSSGARQVEASADPAALDKRAEAQAAYRQAGEAFAAGDFPRANRLLSQASGLMFDAVRLSAPDQVKADKARSDFASRLDSVKALLAAQKRISGEKANVKDASETSRTIERLAAEAEQLAAVRKYDEAGVVLNRAYLTAKAAIGSMRGGDTLVRSLDFATKEEEYRYEIDRNDTHQMLIRVLLDDRKGNEAAIERLVGAARQLREQAEASAGRGDHAGAVKLLEDSTAELVKAIRTAGVYIPG